MQELRGKGARAACAACLSASAVAPFVVHCTYDARSGGCASLAQTTAVTAQTDLSLASSLASPDTLMIIAALHFLARVRCPSR